MKNKFKIKSIYIIIFFLLSICSSNANESFVFDVTEIEITEMEKNSLEKWNATTENGITIFLKILFMIK